MALNQIYMLRHRQTLFTENIENVYFYEHASGTGFSTDLANDWNTVMKPLVLGIQNENVHTVGIDVVNLGELSDFGSVITDGDGVRAGDCLPAFNGLSFTLKPDTRAVRKGGKRIAGISEASQTAGIITDSVLLGAMEDYRLALGDTLVGDSDNWTPIIVKRVRTAVSGTTPTRYTYRLPVNDSELEYAGILAVLTTSHIGHQVSRGN